MRNALKALGAVIVVIALCAPLMFLPVEDTQSAVPGYAGVTVTVPPTVVVATAIPGLATTTSTTAPPAPPAPEPTSSTTTTTLPTDITIAAVGEVLAPPEVLKTIRDPGTGSYDFDPIFAPIAPYLQKADYAVAALGPCLAGPQVGYSSETAPNAPRELAFALKHAGIDLVGTANPDSLDLGWNGVVGTLDRLDQAGLAHTGTSRTSTERNTPVIEDINGIRVGFLDYTTSVSASLPADQKKDYAIDLLNPDTVRQDAETARSWGADAVVAMINYGTDYEETPSDQQVALAQQILDHCGVDVILGYHARTIQTIEHRLTITYAGWQVTDKYAAYSLGDFLFAGQPVTQQTAASEASAAPDTGMVVYLHFEKRGLRTYVTGVSYLPLYLQVATTGATTTGTTVAGDTTTTTAATATTTTTKAGPKQSVTTYRILPVLPGLEPDTDVPLTAADRARMAEIWENARDLLYRPDENISPLSPSDLGL